MKLNQTIDLKKLKMAMGVALSLSLPALIGLAVKMDLERAARLKNVQAVELPSTNTVEDESLTSDLGPANQE